MHISGARPPDSQARANHAIEIGQDHLIRQECAYWSWPTVLCRAGESTCWTVPPPHVALAIPKQKTWTTNGLDGVPPPEACPLQAEAQHRKGAAITGPASSKLARFVMEEW